MRSKKLNFTFLSGGKGFTLVELLVVIVILAILGVVGMTIFTQVTQNAKDAAKKADIEAMAKAYEANYNPISGYIPLENNHFATGAIPAPGEGSYFNDLSSNGGFRVCAAIKNGTSPCTANSETCSCKDSTQIAYTAASPSPSPSPSAEASIPPPEPSPSTNPLAHPLSCDPDQTLATGLAGYWKFDESSGTSATDATGSSPGTVVSGSFGVGYPNSTTMNFGNGVYLPGTTVNYVDLGNTSALDIMGPITISAWVRPAQSTGTTILVARTLGNPATGQYEMYKSGGNLGFRISNGAGFTTSANSNAFSTPNVWTHVVGVFDGTNVRTYRNAVAGTPATITGSQVNYNNNTKVGIRSNNSSPGGSGEVRIDDLRIYNRALSATEVTALYNGGQGCLP